MCGTYHIGNICILNLEVFQLAHLRQSCQFEYVHLGEVYFVASFALASDFGEEPAVCVRLVFRGGKEGRRGVRSQVLTKHAQASVFTTIFSIMWHELV